MGCLFGDKVTTSIVRVVPIAGEDFAQDWVERFLNAPGLD